MVSSIKCIVTLFQLNQSVVLNTEIMTPVGASHNSEFELRPIKHKQDKSNLLVIIINFRHYFWEISGEYWIKKIHTY